MLSNHKLNEKFYEVCKQSQECKNKDDKKPKDGQDTSTELPEEINFAQLKGAC
jgi:hypothetical protein